MPYYVNNPFPFWDFVASSSREHPFFGAYNQGPPPYASRENQSRQGPGAENTDNANTAAPNVGAPNTDHPHYHHYHHGPPRPEGDIPFRGRDGPCGRGRGGHRRGGACGFGGRRHGPPRAWPWGNRAPQDFNDIADLARFFFGGDAAKDTDFSPAVDIFNTKTHIVVHVSLPGAKREDLAVDWDIESKVLKIAGVVYRPEVDEEMLKTLVRDERKVGFFERKIHLDEESVQGKVDDEKDISAKLDNGVLVIRVPKHVEPEPEKEKEKEKEKDVDMSETEKGDAEEEQQEDETEYVRVEVE